MSHITLPEGLPGIIGPITRYPETGEPLRAFHEALMRGPSSLTKADREIIGTHVSSLNSCRFCTMSHANNARRLLGNREMVVDQVLAGYEDAKITDRLKALLTIASKVQQSGGSVTAGDIARARALGADDKAIHDTVLVAAAFCMYNRYVDGLDTDAGEDGFSV